MRFAVFLFALVLGMALPSIASAQVGVLGSIVDFVVGGTPLSASIAGPSLMCPAMVGAGACRLAALFVYAVQRGRFIIAAFAFLIITIAGFRLIISQSEEALTTARRTVLGAVVGLFLVFISESFIDAIYGGFTILPPGSMTTSVPQGALIFSKELMGILRWLETTVAVIAVGLLVVQAARVLSSFGAEDSIRKAYRAAFYTVMGLLLLVFDRVIAAIFGFGTIGAPPGPPNAALFVIEVFGLVRFFLFFVAIIVIGVIVYAGLLMLFNYGNEELIGKSKGILLNAALGLALIAVSFVIVSTMILGLI